MASCRQRLSPSIFYWHFFSYSVDEVNASVAGADEDTVRKWVKLMVKGKSDA